MDTIISKNFEKLKLEVSAHIEHLESFKYANQQLKARFEFQKKEMLDKLSDLKYKQESVFEEKQKILSISIRENFKMVIESLPANGKTLFERIERELAEGRKEYIESREQFIQNIVTLEKSLQSSTVFFQIERSKSILNLKKDIRTKTKHPNESIDLNSLIEYDKLKKEQIFLENKRELTESEKQRLTLIDGLISSKRDKIKEGSLKSTLVSQEKAEKELKEKINTKKASLNTKIKEEKAFINTFFVEKKKKSDFTEVNKSKLETLKSSLIFGLDDWMTIPQDIRAINHTRYLLIETEKLDDEFFVCQHLETLKNYELAFVAVNTQITLPTRTVDKLTGKLKKQDIFMGVISGREGLAKKEGNIIFLKSDQSNLDRKKDDCVCIPNDSIRDLIIRNSKEDGRRFFYTFDLTQQVLERANPSVDKTMIWKEKSHTISVVQDGTEIHVFDSLGSDKIAMQIFNKFILDGRGATQTRKSPDSALSEGDLAIIQQLSYSHNKQKLQHSSGLCEEYAVTLLDYNLRVQLFDNLVGQLGSMRDVLHLGDSTEEKESYSNKSLPVVSTELIIEIQEGLREDPFLSKGNNLYTEKERIKQAIEQSDQLSGGGLGENIVSSRDLVLHPIKPSELKKPIGEQVIFSVDTISTVKAEKGAPNQTFNAILTSDLMIGLETIRAHQEEDIKRSTAIRKAGHVYEKVKRESVFE